MQDYLRTLKRHACADSCDVVPISQSVYYNGCNPFLSHIGQVFETKKINPREAYQNRKINKMKTFIADLSFELKKATRRVNAEAIQFPVIALDCRFCG